MRVNMYKLMNMLYDLEAAGKDGDVAAMTIFSDGSAAIYYDDQTETKLVEAFETLDQFRDFLKEEELLENYQEESE